MPWRRANASAFPGVGEATATTSASSGIAFTDAAMQSAWKREPTIPIFTFDMARSGLDEDLESAVGHALRIERQRRHVHLHARVLHHLRVDAVAVRARSVDDPREHHRLAGLHPDRLREGHHPLHEEIVADAL